MVEIQLFMYENGILDLENGENFKGKVTCVIQFLNTEEGPVTQS